VSLIGNDVIAPVAFYQKGPKYNTKFGKTGKIKGNLQEVD
jgi:hypothetical protein